MLKRWRVVSLHAVFQNSVALVITSGKTRWGYREIQVFRKLEHGPQHYIKPENLYKFCYLNGSENKDRDENITFEHRQMKIKKVTGTLRDFGNTIDIWSDVFSITLW